MPKVRFNTNLGSRDAQALGLKFEECTTGSIVDVDAETVEALKKIGPNLVREATKEDIEEAAAAKKAKAEARAEPKEGEFNKLDPKAEHGKK